MSIVCVEGVSKSYRDGGRALPVLDDVTVYLPRGTTTSLVGASGSGKSTLTSLIAGLLRPDAGRILFEGADLSGMTDAERAALRARRIGVVMQTGNLVGFLSARENVELAIDLAGGARAGARAGELLAELGLSARADHLPRRLSGGEAQRVSLAMALANEPDLLLADELVGELDSDTADRVMDILFEAWRGRGLTVLLVTHDRELAQRTEHQLELVDGRVIRS